MGVKKLKHQEDSTEIQANEPVSEYYASTSFNPAMLFFSSQKVAPKDFSAQVALIKNGITRKAVDDLIKATGLSLSEISGYMHLTERTLRNYSENTRLAPDPSERAMEIALLYEKGREVFGSLEAFKNYMGSPVPALGHAKPKDFLDTSVGIAYLLEELGRIEHGVFS